MIDFREVPFGSTEYQQTVALRREILRWPLGMDLSAEELAAEAADIHFAGLSGDTVVACLILCPMAEGEIKMRQVAVSEPHQGMGVGRALVQAGERLAAERGFRQVVLHARDNVVPFYEALGYVAVGAPFLEIGIPHRAMGKVLTQ